MNTTNSGHFEGGDSQDAVLLVVDDDARTVGIELAADWPEIVVERDLGLHLVEAYRAAVAARDTSQMDQVDLDGLLARLRTLTEMTPEQLREHLGTAATDASWRSSSGSGNDDLLDPEFRATHAERLREIHSETDEVTSPDGLLTLQGIAGQPTGLTIARGWSTRYEVDTQAVQLFALLEELARRHDERLAQLDLEFPGLADRQQATIDRGLDLVRSIPLTEDDEGRRQTDG
ncbi:hypothetical protein ACPYO6_11765 [Georgenia sp. Z1344]|uniref:hypothetical protein n=1 Tax=Georgenia sp. Z1344 TaxID=3416706 RepID=UPI003CE777F3